MNRTGLVRAAQVLVVVLISAALFQELSKPQALRTWHGRVFGIVPYDFRLPSWNRFKEIYWNPYERRVLVPQVWGVGWAFNFYAVLENLGFLRYTARTEEEFLIPNKTMKRLLRQTPEN